MKRTFNIKKMILASLSVLVALVLIHLWRHDLPLDSPARNVPFLYIGLFLHFIWICAHLFFFVYKKTTLIVALKVFTLCVVITALVMVVFFMIMLNVVGA